MCRPRCSSNEKLNTKNLRGTTQVQHRFVHTCIGIFTVFFLVNKTRDASKDRRSNSQLQRGLDGQQCYRIHNRTSSSAYFARLLACIPRHVPLFTNFARLLPTNSENDLETDALTSWSLKNDRNLPLTPQSDTSLSNLALEYFTIFTLKIAPGSFLPDSVFFLFFCVSSVRPAAGQPRVVSPTEPTNPIS